MPAWTSPLGTPVRLLPLAPSPFAVHLLRLPNAEAGVAGDPFLRTEVEPGRCRTYVALLLSETGAELDRLILKLPGEERGESSFPGEEPLSSRALEEEWAAARHDLERLLAAPASFPELVLPAAEAGGPPLLPPTMFCPAANRLFRIPCPRCFGPLRTCRDDALLAVAGLPLFSTSSVRFLRCPACGGGESPEFWTDLEQEAPGHEDRLGGLEALRRLIAAAHGRGGELSGVPETPTAGWTVFNLHDSPYLVTRLAPVPFDDFLERLGGSPEKGAAEGVASSGRLFAAEGSGVDAIEVLALKLAAFLQVVGALGQHHLLLDRPHLDLNPEHLVVEPGSRGDFLPHLWSFRVKLLGGSPGRVARLGPEIAVVLPPPSPRVPFASPAIRAALLATPAAGELLIERVVAEKTGGSFRIEGALVDSQGFYPPPSPHDWIQLAWPAGILGEAPCTTAARLDPRSAPQGMQIAVTTEQLALDPKLARRLGRAGGFRVPGIRYRIYPALNVPEDLYSLGVLLLRMVLVNDGQGISALTSVIEAVAQSSGPERRDGARTLAETLVSLIAVDPQKLAKSNLFHQAVERTSDRPNAVPDELWNELLLLALRLVARDSIFGLTAEPGGTFAFDESNPASHLDSVRAQVEDLLRRLHSILFQRQTVNAEIRAVIADLLAGEAAGQGQGRNRVTTDRM